MSFKLVEFNVSGNIPETSPKIHIYYKKIPVKLKITSIDQLITYLGKCIIIYKTRTDSQKYYLPTTYNKYNIPKELKNEKSSGEYVNSHGRGIIGYSIHKCYIPRNQYTGPVFIANDLFFENNHLLIGLLNIDTLKKNDYVISYTDWDEIYY